ncbi:MAG: hypothetical protein ABI400_03360 [Lacisediminihabitans sp.]
MTAPLRLALASWAGAAGDEESVRKAIDAWASSATLGQLVLACDGRATALRGAALMEWLDMFSGEHWDFRGGAERNLAQEVTLSRELERLVFESAPELGLAGPYPLRKRKYDTILMTGGMVRAGIVKPRFAREVLNAGVGISTVVFLGGFRPFVGDEIELAPLLGVRGDNEFDAMVSGMELAFGPLGDPAVSGAETGRGSESWRVWSWDVLGVTLKVVAAPSSDPSTRRANTADTYRYWASSVREASETSVLVVTTPIYVPYQGAGAVEILGLEHGLAVETVGTSDASGDLGEFSQRFLAQNHLQELRAAIGAMRKLRLRLTAILNDEAEERGE